MRALVCGRVGMWRGLVVVGLLLWIGLLLAVSPRSEGSVVIPKVLAKDPLQIALQASTWIRGTVVDDQGNPVAAAPIAISVTMDTGGPLRFTYPSTGPAATTDAEGCFAIQVCIHRDYALMAARPGSGSKFLWASRKQVKVDDEPIEDFEITIPKAR